jgi:hypothetical protein
MMKTTHLRKFLYTQITLFKHIFKFFISHIFSLKNNIIENYTKKYSIKHCVVLHYNSIIIIITLIKLNQIEKKEKK